MSNILIKHKMPPVNIQIENRKEYYETLRIFQKSGDVRPTLELILAEYKRMETQLKKESKIQSNKLKHKHHKSKL
jgi:hypothetical protein